MIPPIVQLEIAHRTIGVRRTQLQSAPIEEHLQAFEESLEDNTSKHVKLTMSRIRRVIVGAGIASLASLKVDNVASFLRQLRKEENLGHRTYNHYVQAIDGFCNWLVAGGRLVSNPLASLERLNAEVDVRHKRRALTPEEFAALLDAARNSKKKVQCYTGPERARVYLLSYMTGLRRKELASLTPASFLLEGEQPVLRVEAACSKRRKHDVLPLHAELIPILRTWIEGLEEDEYLFPGLAKKKTWLMVQKDLEDAGIPYKTKDGVADFHAAGRHTHVTELLRSGATLPEARELARHSDVRLTMRYTHIGLDDQAKALSGLPLPKRADKVYFSSWQRIGSGSCVPPCHSTSSGGTKTVAQGGNRKRKNPRRSEGYGTEFRPKSPFGCAFRQTHLLAEPLTRSSCWFSQHRRSAMAKQQRDPGEGSVIGVRDC